MNLIESLERSLDFENNVSDTIVEVNQLLDLANSPTRFDSKKQLIEFLDLGASLKVNTIGSKALGLPSGQYVVQTISESSVELIRSLDNGFSYDLPRSLLFENWNRVERLINQRIDEAREEFNVNPAWFSSDNDTKIIKISQDEIKPSVNVTQGRKGHGGDAAITQKEPKIYIPRSLVGVASATVLDHIKSLLRSTGESVSLTVKPGFEQRRSEFESQMIPREFISPATLKNKAYQSGLDVNDMPPDGWIITKVDGVPLPEIKGAITKAPKSKKVKSGRFSVSIPYDTAQDIKSGAADFAALDMNEKSAEEMMDIAGQESELTMSTHGNYLIVHRIDSPKSLDRAKEQIGNKIKAESRIVENYEDLPNEEDEFEKDYDYCEDEANDLTEMLLPGIGHNPGKIPTDYRQRIYDEQVESLWHLCTWAVRNGINVNIMPRSGTRDVFKVLWYGSDISEYDNEREVIDAISARKP